jgi:hypothetical protein
MKNIILLSLTFFSVVQTIKAQDSLGYGLKIPTETQIKSVPYSPSFNLPSNIVLPQIVSLADKMPPVGNQGYQGSCVAFTISYALKSYQEKKQYNWNFIENGNVRNDRICSPSFIFNTVKQLTNNYNCLEGIYFVEGFDILRNYGTAFSIDFPYTDANCSNQPDDQVIQKASVNKISSFKGVNYKNLSEIKYNLYVGNPVVLGVMLDDFFQPDGFDAFRDKRHYTFIPKSILNPSNYHAMLCVGYNDKTNTFQILNSWGEDWGNSGYVDIPYSWFPVVVQEAYTMNDAFQYASFVDVTKKEVETQKSASNASVLSAWFKEGYYHEYKGIRLGLTFLDTKDSSATVIFSDIKNNEIFKTLTYKINSPQTFYYLEKKITFTLTDIAKAGKNPLNKAAYFVITIDNSVDNEIKEKIDRLNFLMEQKNTLDKLIKQQQLLLENK